MFDNVTINIHLHIGEGLMSTFEELLAKVENIASAQSVEEVKQEINTLVAALQVNAENDANTTQLVAASKLTADENRQLIEAILNKLAVSAPAPTA